LAGPVATGASRKIIVFASLAGAIVAAPVSILSGVFATCSLGDPCEEP
jgi:hypothetical protein